MERPRITLHALTSLDGRLDGFPPAVALYYELAAALPHQAVLTGTGTLLAAAAREGIDMTAEEVPPAARSAVTEDDARPLLVIVDSVGRITRFAWLRGQPFWRDLVVLCSSATPAGHLERLRRHRVDHMVMGDDHVDLGAALAALGDRYGVRAVRVDAGGILNGALLGAGLVDELSVVVAAYLVGTAGERPLHVVERLGDNQAQRLDLISAETLRDGHVWLRYAVLATGGRCHHGQTEGMAEMREG
jgi:2,5-diamino-6-(ribosylamino)-4(3H)-pyrimidinone 5'-phosphate reductase